MAMIRFGDDISASVIGSSIYEWNPELSYKKPSYVLGNDGKIYFALEDSQGKNPLLNKGTYWEDYFKYSSKSLEEIIDSAVKRVSSSVPVGTIIPWMFSQDPPGSLNDDGTRNWLECSGGSIDPIKYPELYYLCGNYLPDLRGYFLRGLGGNSSSLGAVQEDMNKAHTHNLYIQTYLGGGPRGFIQDEDGSYGIWFTTDSSGGVESRPINRAVRYMIRSL